MGCGRWRWTCGVAGSAASTTACRSRRWWWSTRQVVKGGRAGGVFHEWRAKYRLGGAKRVVAVDYVGLAVGAGVVGARRREVGAAGDLLVVLLPRHPGVLAVLGDWGLRGLEGPLVGEYGVGVEIKHGDRAKGGFKPVRPLWGVEGCFAELGRWRRLARGLEATPAWARAWMQVACVGWLLTMI